MGKGKLFKAAATIAAIGGVCYVFRDKIKNSTVYQSLDMDDKVEKVKHTIKENVAAQNFCQNFSKLLTKLFGKYFRYL